MAERADRRVSHRSYVSYIDKSREYYAAHGYEVPYQWAAFDDVPFTKLAKPLAHSNVAVVTTTFLHAEDAPGNIPPVPKKVYQHPVAEMPGRMFTEDLSWDKDATHTNDTESYLPLARLDELVESGRIGQLNHRFFGVPTEYSQRKTGLDADTIGEWCREDDVDVVILVPL